MPFKKDLNFTQKIFTLSEAQYECYHPLGQIILIICLPIYISDLVQLPRYEIIVQQFFLYLSLIANDGETLRISILSGIPMLAYKS